MGVWGSLSPPAWFVVGSMPGAQPQRQSVARRTAPLSAPRPASETQRGPRRARLRLWGLPTPPEPIAPLACRPPWSDRWPRDPVAVGACLPRGGPAAPN
ncbi:hypothetical protein NDU88_002399 [Pleurodeles waltl]|uniref:Uncharacterized protein n=1 Tax=Pleurodeles waltl TaxID=8319 RepID=A0AAV7NH28_PLEWA|nr:hypothetical protein NDU88_002399 [Pleurodeles waltl]